MQPNHNHLNWLTFPKFEYLLVLTWRCLLGPVYKEVRQPACPYNLSYPVKFRIDFKILLFTFKAIYGHAPGYLIDLIAVKEQPCYNLRSASGLILKYPSLKLKKTLGARAFSSAAPNLWNNLPLHIHLEDTFERFKSLLKTHLFRLAFDT